MTPIININTRAFWQTYLSDPANITMEGILIFNKHLLFLLTVIVLFVAWLLFYTILSQKPKVKLQMARPFLQILKRFEWCSEKKKDRNLPICQIFVDFEKIRQKGHLAPWEKELVRVGLQNMCMEEEGLPWGKPKNVSKLAALGMKACVCHPRNNNWTKEDYIILLTLRISPISIKKSLI